MDNQKDIAWKLFVKTGSVENYLKYWAVKNQGGDLHNATDGKGACNKRK